MLVGVINRKSDLKRLLEQRWYRIPQGQMPRGVYAEYLAFFLSGSAARGKSGSGIYYYAERRGVELAYRRDLLPEEAQHPRAGDVYYRVLLSEAVPRLPPITNPTRRRLDFIHTTWDRFLQARHVQDLYSRSDYFVDRIYHALRDARYRSDRYWETEQRSTGHAPQLRVLCERGTVVAGTQPGSEVDVLLDEQQSDDAILAQIRARILSKGGPLTVNIPPVR
ncbi:MAG: hypothetical protein MUE40_10840 [Anaerolineae bacterium]|nr:hypothetical protein [Anaerolineae bacterium]